MHSSAPNGNVTRDGLPPPPPVIPPDVPSASVSPKMVQLLALLERGVCDLVEKKDFSLAMRLLEHLFVEMFLEQREFSGIMRRVSEKLEQVFSEAIMRMSEKLEATAAIEQSTGAALAAVKRHYENYVEMAQAFKARGTQMEADIACIFEKLRHNLAFIEEQLQTETDLSRIEEQLQQPLASIAEQLRSLQRARQKLLRLRQECRRGLELVELAKDPQSVYPLNVGS